MVALATKCWLGYGQVCMHARLRSLAAILPFLMDGLMEM